jgi:hypothetical protein
MRLSVAPAYQPIVLAYQAYAPAPRAVYFGPAHIPTVSVIIIPPRWRRW